MHMIICMTSSFYSHCTTWIRCSIPTTILTSLLSHCSLYSILYYMLYYRKKNKYFVTYYYILYSILTSSLSIFFLVSLHALLSLTARSDWIFCSILHTLLPLFSPLFNPIALSLLHIITSKALCLLSLITCLTAQSLCVILWTIYFLRSSANT